MQLIKCRSFFACNVFEKWDQSLLEIFKLNWKNVQNKCKAKKDSSFMWLLWHQMFVVNNQQANINHNIPMNYSSYEYVTSESVTHRFQFCSRIIKAWELAFSFFIQLRLLISIIGSKKTLKLEQCLFNKCLLNKIMDFP